MSTKKRGHTFLKGKLGVLDRELTLNAFDIVLMAVVILSLFAFITNAKNQTVFEKNYLSHDLAATINTIYAAPGELTYRYEEPTDDIAIRFSPSTIVLTNTQEDAKHIETTYYYGQDKRQPLRVTSGEQDIVLIKSSDALTVTGPRLYDAIQP